MKSALSLMLSICLVGSAIPLAAQESVADISWSRVGQLPPGSEIIVTVKGLPPVQRYVVSRDDSVLSIADRAGAFEDIARVDIVEIKTPVPYSPGRDALKGLIVGSAAYGLIGAGMCHAFGGTGSCVGGVSRVAALGGGFMAGVSVAAGAVKHRVKRTRVIYHAP